MTDVTDVTLKSIWWQKDMEIRTISPGEEPFLIEAPHTPGDWQDPDRVGNWAPKVQLAQTAQALDDQGVVGHKHTAWPL